MPRDLFEYQKHAVAHMTQIESASVAIASRNEHTAVEIASSCGMLADPTGSGKTTTTVAFVKSRFGELKHRAESLHMVRSFGTFVTESISFRPAAVELALDTTIVVVSPNLVEQWRRETYSVTGESPLTLNTAAQVRTYLERPANELLVVVNENRYRLFCTLSAVLSVGFARLVFDECRHLCCLQTSSASKPVTAFTWFICASATDKPEASDFFPSSVHQLSMMASMNQLPAALVQAMTVRTPLHEIEYPGTVVYRTYNCRSLSHVTDIIADTMEPDMRSRIMAGDIQGALAILGAESASDIYTVVVHRLNRDLRHIRFLISEIEKDVEAGARIHAHVENRLGELRAKENTLVRQIESSETRFQTLLAHGECSICLDKFTEPVLISCCSNVFCSKCIVHAQCSAQKCPLCRSTAYRLHRVVSDGTCKTVDPEMWKSPKSKVDVLRSVLQGESARKVLVYAEYEVCWPLIHDIAKESGATPMRLTGHARSRCEVLAQFQTADDRCVLFANAINDCSGIDLPMTTDIILWHMMGSTKTNQIIGRCRRVSTESSAVCTVHRLYEE